MSNNQSTINKKALTAVVLIAIISAAFIFYDMRQPTITQALPLPENYKYQLNVPQTGERVVCVVFDDGWQTQYTNAIPILNQYGFKATFGIITSYTNTKPGYMTWNEIITLAKAGQDIESHTVHHLPLATLGTDAVINELSQSKQELLNYGINAPIFLYPEGSGAGNATIENLVQQYYLVARGTYSGSLNMTQPFDKYNLPSYTMSSTTTVSSFKDFVNGANDSTIVIVYYHKISDDGTSTATTPQNFAAEMQYLHDNGFTVKTLKQLFITTVS